MSAKLVGALALLLAPVAMAAGLLEEARNRCAAQLGAASSELEDVIENTTTLPATKVTFSAFKFLRPDVPGFCQIALLPDGTEVSGDELLQAEFSALWTKFGALTPTQDATLKKRQVTASVSGIFVLARVPTTPDFRGASSPRVAKAEYLSTFAAPTLSQLSSSFPSGQFEALPDMFAIRFQMKVGDLRAAARWTAFSSVSIDEAEGVLLSNDPMSWYGSGQFGLAHATGNGGGGGRVGVVESGNIAPNPIIPTLVVRRAGTAGGDDVDHAQEVVGMVANVFSGVAPGGAPSAAVDFAGNSRLAGNNFDTTRLALGVLLTIAEDAYNFSWYEGPPTGQGWNTHTREPLSVGKFLDEQAYDLGITVVAGAGNIKVGSPPDYANVPSPANGLNVVAVGQYIDLRDSKWEGDMVSPLSSWVNPTGVFGGRPKPDVVASADVAYVWNATTVEWRGGTSLAAPQVSSIAALLGGEWRRQGHLNTLPNEIVRAVIAAAAQHNVDGVSVPRRVGGSYPLVPLSEFDGAGGIDAAGALDIFVNNRAYLIAGPSFCPSNGTAAMQPLPGARFSLSSGDRARVALAYSSLPNSLNAPTADFDIVVAEVNSAGQATRLTAWSGFRDNTLEVIEFRADAPANFQVFYMNSTLGPCTPPRYIGYAWWPKVPTRP
ncbi:MAG: S8 family serine peptidase [Myxococcus sp.]|nr:S8 family serine peptidase [Myxococcus sp.]